MTFHRDISCTVPSFPLQLGGESGVVEVNCCLWGSLSRPLHVVMGGISADRWAFDVPGERQGWWRQVAHDQAVLNTRDCAFLTFDYFCFPDRVTNPPVLTPADQAQLLRGIQHTLQLPQFHAVIGSSFGGMVSLAFAARYPDALQRLVCLAAADRNSVKSQAIRHVQRQLVQLGEVSASQGEHLKLARALAMIGYRGEQEFEQRFQSQQPGKALQQVSAYLNHHGEQFVNRFSAHRYLQLSRAIDHHQVDAEDIRVPSLLIGFDSDQMVPVNFLEQLHNKLNAPSELHILESLYGHDGFLLESEAINSILHSFLSEYRYDLIERNSRCAGGY